MGAGRCPNRGIPMRSPKTERRETTAFRFLYRGHSLFVSPRRSLFDRSDAWIAGNLGLSLLWKLSEKGFGLGSAKEGDALAKKGHEASLHPLGGLDNLFVGEGFRGDSRGQVGNAGDPCHLDAPLPGDNRLRDR